MIGQVRGFDLDSYLSDYEEAGTSIPWAIGDTGWVSEKDADTPSAGMITVERRVVNHSKLMAMSGVQPKLKVLYVSDYVPRSMRIQATSRLHRCRRPTNSSPRCSTHSSLAQILLCQLLEAFFRPM